MEQSLAYRLSLGFTLLLTFAAVITLFGWMGTLINGIGHLPLFALIPWTTLALVALTALNCTIRARRFIHRARLEQ